MALPYSHSDLAYSTLSTGYSAGATAIVVQTGKGALFPAANFKITIWNEATYGHAGKDSNAEIRTCSSRSGDTLTIDALVNAHVSGEGVTQGIYTNELDIMGYSANAQTVNTTIPAGHTKYVYGAYEIATGTSLELVAGACLEIG